MPLGPATVVRRSLNPASDRGDKGGASGPRVARAGAPEAGDFVRARPHGRSGGPTGRADGKRFRGDEVAEVSGRRELPLTRPAAGCARAKPEGGYTGSMITLSVIKADTGGFVGHSAVHPDMMRTADEQLRERKAKGFIE